MYITILLGIQGHAYFRLSTVAPESSYLFIEACRGLHDSHMSERLVDRQTVDTKKPAWTCLLQYHDSQGIEVLSVLQDFSYPPYQVL